MYFLPTPRFLVRRVTPRYDHRDAHVGADYAPVALVRIYCDAERVRQALATDDPEEHIDIYDLTTGHRVFSDPEAVHPEPACFVGDTDDLPF